MDELLFHLCTMSDSLHNTLPAKENLIETQSNSSFPLSDHVYYSDSEVIILLLHCTHIIHTALCKHIYETYVCTLYIMFINIIKC